MLKKASFLSSYSCLNSCAGGLLKPVSSTSPSSISTSRLSPLKKSNGIARCRGFADVRSSRDSNISDNCKWPPKKVPLQPPTPYEIFDLERGAVYTKHKFYEMVKIYHPDRNGLQGTDCGGISQVEKLERYRLLVLAHQILSDPIKRREYDQYGLGWGHHGNADARYSQGYHSRATDKPFGTGPGCDSSPFANATWEDWERWYRRAENHDRQAYHGTFAHPNAFASFVILMAVISGIVQATRASQYSGTLEHRAQAFTEETSRFLSSRVEHYNETNMTSDCRVKHFLERRDPSKYGLKEEEEGVYRRHFLPQGEPLASTSEASAAGDTAPGD